MNPALVQLAQVKDSRWLTLEVCREYQRNKCSRTENECKFAHPPPHVEVTNGRVVCCYDSIKGKCQRKEPPCKYLHPPQHLREQLLQNGRNNLILKNIQMQILSQTIAAQGSIQGGMQSGLLPIAAMEPTGKLMAYPSAFPSPGAYSVLAQPSASMQPYLNTTAVPSPPNAPATYNPFIGAGGAALPLVSPAGAGSAAAAAAMNDLLMATQTSPQVSQTTAVTLANGSINVSSSGLPSGMPGGLPSGLHNGPHNGLHSNLPNCVSIGSLGSAIPHPSHKPTLANATTRATSETQVGEVLKAPKRTLEVGDEFFPLNMGMLPYTITAPKRPAVADTKSGLPVYQPAQSPAAMAAYQQALVSSGMQLPGQQPAFIPSSFGHPSSVPRF